MNQKIADFLAILLGVRKMAVMFSLLLIAVVFRIKGLIDGSQLVGLLQGTSIAFFAANSVEHVGETIKKYMDTKGQVTEQKDFSVGDGSGNG